MEKKVLIETSARHLHLTEGTLEKLFGKGAKLTHKKDLSQPGQFASNERVTVVGPRNQIERVTILGPCRNIDQVEVSATDARTLGIEACVRESGNIEGSPGIKLIGPKGEVTLKQGAIVAKRHIHATVADAKRLGIKDKEIVQVEVKNDSRSIVFGDVVIRVSDSYKLAMHVDTDESNAGLLG